MSSSYRMDTQKTAEQTERQIIEQFRKWNPKWGKPIVTEYTFARRADRRTDEASVSFVLRGQSVSVACSSQSSYRDNLRCVFYAIESLRMNEVRGIADTMREAYLQLAAPARARDPYEVLGIRPDALREIVDAAYRALAKSAHPDAGGSEDAMKELNDARDRVYRDRGWEANGG